MAAAASNSRRGSVFALAVGMLMAVLLICTVTLYTLTALHSNKDTNCDWTVWAPGSAEAAMGRKSISEAQTTTASTQIDHSRNNKLHNTHEQTFAAALLTLKCFTTPGCFPAWPCRTGKPQRVRRKKKWEEQGFCVDDLVQAARDKENKNHNEPCLIYSFGIHTSWEWEEKVARLFGCQVHAFDPTMNHSTNLAPGVTFHQLGLQGVGTDMTASHADDYDALDSAKLLSLDAIMERLGHTHRTLDVLMMDCEGCEWGVLRQLFCASDDSSSTSNNTAISHPARAVVNQLVVEFHFQKNLGILSEADVLTAADAVVCLEHNRWGIVSHETSGINRQDADYVSGVTKVVHGSGFLLNLALQRLPDDEPLPWERTAAIAKLSKKWDKLRVDCTEKFGKSPSDLPTEFCPEYRQINKELWAATYAFEKATQRRSNFDTPERLDEDTWMYRPRAATAQ